MTYHAKSRKAEIRAPHSFFSRNQAQDADSVLSKPSNGKESSSTNPESGKLERKRHAHSPEPTDLGTSAAAIAADSGHVVASPAKKNQAGQGEPGTPPSSPLSTEQNHWSVSRETWPQPGSDSHLQHGHGLWFWTGYEGRELAPENTRGSRVVFGGEFPPALALATKVLHALDNLQLLLNGGGDVHIIWDVDVTDIAAYPKEVIQLVLMPTRVHVGDFEQADVHDSIDTDYASTGHIVTPQVHCGYLAPEALQ
ncbi:Uracil-DNA glycosylase [Plecturocebus cupreus]